MGSGFRLLIASSWSAYLGDGFALAALPLLVASRTHNPSLVALAALLQRLPWLLFGLLSGVVADKFNRIRLVVLVEAVRAGLLITLAATILLGWANITLLLVAAFAIGVSEVFSDTATDTITPTLIRSEDLPLATSRRYTGVVTLNQLAGPPIGSILYAAGTALPFIDQAMLVAAGALTISHVKLPPHQRSDAKSHLGREVVEGWRCIVHNDAVRTLFVTIFIFNITFGAAWAVLVLFAEERLGLGSFGFGILTAASAVGGVIGTTFYGWFTRKIALSNILRVGLIIEALTHLSFALTRNAIFATVVMTIFGAHAFIWGTTAVTVRQRSVPTELQGRVGSVYSIGMYAGIVFGSALGGVIGSHFGITAPFWFAFYGSALFIIVIWRQLSHLSNSSRG
ncbi:MAG: MFS transporter [Actinomycetota bacterium]|nr:MFS transporter [Actinomycetota bacterium]